jgi:hypothetical protein
MRRSIRCTLVFLFTSFALYCCRPNSPQVIVDKAIAAHGGEKFEKVKIEFDFRGRHYTSTRDKGKFTYTREFTDSTGHVKDILTNDNFRREINGNPATITQERAQAFSNSVNSVIYFALLPYGLNDPAVRKSFVGESTIKGSNYHLIRVTFDEEGGGKDFEDVFLFWINPENFRVDYFAYSYKSDGGGIRFREAINSRFVGDILFQDYHNFMPRSDTVALIQVQELFEENDLEKLSVIQLENIKVESL